MPPITASRGRRLAALHHDRAADRGGRRDELFGPERLAAHARQLARHQVVAPVRVSNRLPLRQTRGPLLARLRRNDRVLADVRATLDDATRRGLDVSPAGAWLLDNYFVIQEQVREIRASMPAGYYRELPKLDAPSAFAGFPRVYELAIELISHTDGCVELQNIELLVREYQFVTPLTIGELWALPVMLRMGLLENVRRMALRTARDLADQDSADRWVTRFRAGSLASKDALARELSAFVHAPPELTPAFLTRFIQQLRSRRADFTPLFWLEQWIAEDGMSVEEATQRSTQRLALTQLVMANSITSLRTVQSLDWRAFVEGASVTETTLRRDPAGIYPAMTFETRDRYRHAVERLAKRAQRAEPDVAAIAIAVAEAAMRPESPERHTHVGYYLVDEGRADLERALSYKPSPGERARHWVLRHPSLVYFGALALATFWALMFFLLPLPGHAGAGALIAAACLAFLPATAAAIAVVNELVTSVLPPTRLPRLDFAGGVPATNRAIVVVPILLWSEDAAHDAFDRLETQYLANRDPEIRFALLSDVPDAAAESTAADAAIVRGAIARVRRLNEKYDASRAPFYFFHRPRRWNPGEGVWMGWERKRGKLSEFNEYLRGGARDAFLVVEGDTAWLSAVRYVITLDADTVLPRGAAQHLIGTIAHPLVRAVYDESRGLVTHGYGILQPRVSVTLESANRSRFARIFAGHPGIDPYTTAVSDVYQDLYAEGTFTGKGIYDVDVFERTTRGRFPENSLLSHDLIEGIFARAALVTDIEVFDDFPSRYLTAVRRQHRWIRGDWQLLPWLGARIPGHDGPTPNPLPALSQWKILDNMRRSLVPVATLLWLLLAWLFLPGGRLAWLGVVLASLAIPLVAAPIFAALRPPAGQSWRPYYAAVAHDTVTVLTQFGLAVVFLPHQALVSAQAIVRTLYRVLISRRHLLEWQTASRVERVTASTRDLRWRRFGVAIAAALLIAGLSLWRVLESATAGDRMSWVVAFVFGVVWVAVPEIAHALSAPLRRRELTLSPADRVAALRYARLHWEFFARLVNPETHWLAPDNFQETPVPLVATRTSPTNIGLQLLATASAYDLGFLSLEEMLQRLERACESMARMRRFHGHFFNWYDVTDLRVLDPPYVSTVDSGNLAGHLIALAEMCRALARQGNAQDARLHALAERAKAFAMDMDFRLVFDARRKLFSIGYDPRTAKLDTSFYDLLASEARLASFVAVAKGDVPAEHWFRLARSLTTASGATALVSWSGSMFEYLMPVLVMPSRPFSLLDQTHRAAVRRQIHYGHARGVPWGMSESAYNLRDRHGTYQYRAFGVPDLALRRGLANDLVVAPYATALALLVEPHEALGNLATLEAQGALGDYGFHDAVDYTRPEPGTASAVVRLAMAHHIGMSLVALDNALHLHRGEGVWQRRFMADPMVRAAELLLDERVPRLYVVQQSQSDAPRAVPERPVREGPILREFLTPDTREPRVALLGGLPYCVLLTNAGSGYSRANGMAVTRWRADATRDDTGQWVYIRDVGASRFWSATHQPTGVPADDYQATFATDRALFDRHDGAVDTHTEIVVVPREQAEIRRVTVTNRSRTAREIELTSYGEIVLTDPDADRIHPAFQSLFVETEWVPSRAAVVASRRPRSSDESRPWCAHVIAAGPEQVGPVTCETDRARFIGRGRTARRPRALDDGVALSGTVGAVLDPIFALRVRVRLDGGRAATVAFTTIVGQDRETVLQHADRYRELSASDRALALSWTEAQVELRDFDLTSAEAALYQDLAGALLYPHEELLAQQFERAENRRGQQALWAHGISGDWPIVLGTISQDVGLSSVRQLLLAHRYWRMKGITSDLVILNDRGPTYQQELQDQLTAMLVASSEGALVDRPGGVCIRRSDLLGTEDVALLRATARINVVCDGVGLGQLTPATELAQESQVRESQVRRERESLVERPERDRDAGAMPRVPAAESPERHPGRLAGNGDYEVRVAGAQTTPAPWANVIANPNAGFCITERGGGFSWVENSFFYRLTPWYNDPVSDPCGEVLYLRDSETGRVWTPTPGPSAAQSAAGMPEPEYTARHAPGMTTFAHVRDDIATELTLAVPESDPVKISRLRITNQGARRRHLTLTSYVEWTLGAQREHTRHQIHTSHDTITGAILAQNFFTDDFASCIAFSWMSEPVAGFTANREEFIGRNGDLSAPVALDRELLAGASGAGYDPCAALRCTLTLEPGETRTIVVLLGAVRGVEDARAIIARTGDPDAAGAALARAVATWNARLSTITVQTPDPEFDALTNRWSLYQALSCRMWGRSGFYQSSGAYGFRDQLQDSMAFVYAAPSVTREHLVRCAGRQFTEGDVQHWWHEPRGRGIRTRFSDDLVWLPFVADHYVSVTGDDSVWDERANYLEMRALAPGEQDAYDLPATSAESGTLYEHCVRALDHACTTGVHGLPLMGCGDWNDGMNRVGAGGQGESVWLAWFLLLTLRRFAEHAETRGDGTAAQRFRARANEYAAAVEAHGWDGAWYRRAYYDDGTPLGSASSGECQIDAIAQSWSVISRVGTAERARTAMRAVHEKLVREDARLIMLLTPPFDQTPQDPGYIKGYVPGVRENGAQYTHAALWTVLATALIGDGDRAYRLFDMLNPFTHARTIADVERYKVEPFVVCADVYTADGHVGRGGWTWYTGSAAWTYRVAVETILGFVKRGDHLVLDPCVPSNWHQFTIDYRFGDTRYTIIVNNPAGVSRGVAAITLDGRVLGDGMVPLADDAVAHRVVVTMRMESNIPTGVQILAP